MGLCLLRIISFVVSEWKTTVSWLLLLHRTTLFWEEKMAFLLQTLQYSGYFRQSSWPCLEQSRFGLGLPKDLSALEKLRYWDSQKGLLHPPSTPLFPGTQSPYAASTVPPLFHLDWSFLDNTLRARFFFSDFHPLPEFLLFSVFTFISQGCPWLHAFQTGLSKAWIYMTVWQGVCVAPSWTVTFSWWQLIWIYSGAKWKILLTL